MVPTNVLGVYISNMSSSHHCLLSVPRACSLLNSQNADQFAESAFIERRPLKYPWEKVLSRPGSFGGSVEMSAPPLPGGALSVKTPCAVLNWVVSAGVEYQRPLNQVKSPIPSGLRSRPSKSSKKTGCV